MEHVSYDFQSNQQLWIIVIYFSKKPPIWLALREAMRWYISHQGCLILKKYLNWNFLTNEKYDIMCVSFFCCSKLSRCFLFENWRMLSGLNKFNTEWWGLNERPLVRNVSIILTILILVFFSLLFFLESSDPSSTSDSCTSDLFLYLSFIILFSLPEYKHTHTHTHTIS